MQVCCKYVCVIQSMWPDGGPADANKTWVRNSWETMRKHSTVGNYVNFQTSDEADQRTSDSYRDNFDRLRRVESVTTLQISSEQQHQAVLTLT